MFAPTSQINDDGLRASYNSSLLITKSGKPHTIGEKLILPAVEEVLKTVLHKPASDIIKRIPLSNNTVERRIDEMSSDIESFLCNYLQTTHLSIQLDESTLPDNAALLLAYFRFIMNQQIYEELLFARTLITDTKDSESRFEDILTMVIPPWIINPYGDIEETNVIIQEELTELSTNEELQVQFKNGYQQFWLQNDIPVTYPAADTSLAVTRDSFPKLHRPENFQLQLQKQKINTVRRYLASGNTFTDIHYTYRFGISTISGIVELVCDEIWRIIKRIVCRNYPDKSGKTLHLILKNSAVIVDYISMALDKQQIAADVFIDLEKAFDVVSIDILLDKLFKMGFRVVSYSLIESYLYDRKHYIKLLDIDSEWLSSTYGVPQGSVLGPPLYSLYVLNLKLANLSGRYSTFADTLYWYILEQTKLA
ncbi:unnamed protein product [Acanthoscelides obtectus]|uniref:Reverse transcriptase domain-containing protein n=1 Tax=Acanthoscelides obtectus TaxID=200917 RepID=A0A9P0MN49_ACAOB|nr:unnamed protein product [Acanthoscelides obtectus]CAK1689090.1 SCAN domain-containing protein 3 [Acanthoscelides obtectus]